MGKWDYLLGAPVYRKDIYVAGSVRTELVEQMGRRRNVRRSFTLVLDLNGVLFQTVKSNVAVLVFFFDKGTEVLRHLSFFLL